MSKSRIRVWLAIFLCTVVMFLVLLKTDGIDVASTFLSGMGLKILIYIGLYIAVFLVGIVMKKYSEFDKNSIFVLSWFVVICVGILLIFYQSERRLDQYEKEQGTLDAIEKEVITAADLGLAHIYSEKIDQGESYWKSWLEYTVTLQNYGSIQYNCDRYVDKTDAGKRLDNYIKSDGYRGEMISVPLEMNDTELDRLEAYEWISEGDGSEESDDTVRIRVFYYYLQADEMIFRLKYRNAICLDEEQLALVIQWFLDE